MKKLVPALFLLLTCDVVDRSQSDYLMWNTQGTVWSFIVKQGQFPGDTFYLRLVGTQDTSFAPETADVCLDWEGRREYYANKGDVIDLFVDFPVFPGGEVVPLEHRLIPFMHYPPVLHDSWQDTLRGKALYAQDTFDYTLSTEGRVDSLLEMEVPFGVVDNVYKITLEQRGSCDSLWWVNRKTLFLGPDLGIIKAIIGPDSLGVGDSSWVEDLLELELMDMTVP